MFVNITLEPSWFIFDCLNPFMSWRFIKASSVIFYKRTQVYLCYGEKKNAESVQSSLNQQEACQEALLGLHPLLPESFLLGRLVPSEKTQSSFPLLSPSALKMLLYTVTCFSSVCSTFLFFVGLSSEKIAVMSPAINVSGLEAREENSSTFPLLSRRESRFSEYQWKKERLGTGRTFETLTDALL